MDFKSSYTLVPPPTSLNRPRKAIFLLILSTFAVFLFSCKGGLFASPDDGIVIRTYDADSWRDGGNRYSGRGRSVFRTPDDSGTENYTYEISLAREKRVYKKTVASGTVVVIENIPVGPWTITCRAYKSDGSLEYMGSVDVEIVADETTAATVELKKWTAGNTTITFKANGGTGDDCTQTVTCGTTVNLNGNTFTREGYAFKGWNTKADGSGTYYPNKTSFTATDSNELTLYAQWFDLDSLAGKVYREYNTSGGEDIASYYYFSSSNEIFEIYNSSSVSYRIERQGTISQSSMTATLTGSAGNTTYYQIKLLADKIIMCDERALSTKLEDTAGLLGTWKRDYDGQLCIFSEDGTMSAEPSPIDDENYYATYSIIEDGLFKGTHHFSAEYTPSVYGYFEGNEMWETCTPLEEVTDSEIINNVINAVPNP